MTDLELELRDLAAHLDVPPAPPLFGTVLARVTRRRRRRRVLAVAVACAVAALAVALAVPGSRASLLRFFHVRGATVALVDRLPPVTSHRWLGQPIAPNEASFRLLLPSRRRPERVYAGDGGYWLRYRGEPGIWIGGRHALYLPGGPPVAAGRALIWQHGPVTLRLEAAVGLERALAVARSVR